MSSDFLPKTEKRSLRYDFTAKETHDLSLTLANKTKEVNALIEEKKSVVSQFTAKVNEAKATCNKLSNQVSDGFEYRDVECEIQYHVPQQGKKTIIRKDSNRTTAIEAMTEYEFNLFNQPPDEFEDDFIDDNQEPVGKKTKRKKKKKATKKGTSKTKKGDSGVPVSPEEMSSSLSNPDDADGDETGEPDLIEETDLDEAGSEDHGDTENEVPGDDNDQQENP